MVIGCVSLVAPALEQAVVEKKPCAAMSATLSASSAVNVERRRPK
jgi:hypothetical protein